MATDARTITFAQTTDAEIRAWVAAFEAAMAAIGMVDNGDTGQIDSSTCSKPASANQIVGWHAYDMGGWVLMVGFGSSDDAATQACLYYRMGFATDGALTMTGTQQSGLMEVRALQGATSSANNECRFSLVDGALTIAINLGLVAGGRRTVVSFDLARDDSGARITTGTARIIGQFANNGNGENYIIQRDGASVGRCTVTIPSAGGLWGTKGLVGNDALVTALMNDLGSQTWSRGGVIGVVPICGWDAALYGPGVGVIGYSAIDATIETEFTVNIFGVDRTYLATGCNYDSHSSNHCLAMLWE